MSAWKSLAPGVHVRQSRAYAMNSLVVVSEDHALVVDPGVAPSELDDLAARVAEWAPRFERVTLAFSHPHWDHVLGRDWFPAATTLAHVGFADELERDAERIEAAARAWIEGAGEAWPRPFRAFAPELAVRGVARVERGPFEIECHEIPGHCASQVAFFLPRCGVLFAADTLSDIEIPWLDAPPWIHRRSLLALGTLLEHEDVRFLVPGHGAVADGRADGYRRVLRDVDYLLALERNAREAFGRGLPLADAQEELAAMDYTGKDAEYAMNDVHRENVRFTYDGLAVLAGRDGA